MLKCVFGVFGKNNILPMNIASAKLGRLARLMFYYRMLWDLVEMTFVNLQKWQIE